MPNFIRRLAVDRRRFLKGMGASLALPLLDAMQPAMSRAAADAPTRAVFIFAPNGKNMQAWRPEARGRNFKLSPTLEPLASVRGNVSVLSGLTIDGGRAHGDGPGDHARAAGSYLTCAHPKKTGGADILTGVSVDQVIAAEIGQSTRFASLELGLDRGRRAGSCDSGYSCAYSNNISWRTPNTPVAKETRPREVFTRLFGDPADASDAAERAQRAAARRSVVDVVIEEARALRRDLGAADRGKLDEYLEALRGFERGLSNESKAGTNLDGAESILDGGNDRATRTRQMYDLMALAFRADLVRVVTFMLGNAGSNVSYRDLGVADGHHDTSHHGRDAAKLDKLARIDRHQIELFAGFLAKLDAAKEGGQSILDRSCIVYGSGISDGDRHDHGDLPVLLCGGGNGKLSPGRHVTYAKNTPMADLYVSLLHLFGVRTESFADSKGALGEI